MANNPNDYLISYNIIQSIPNAPIKEDKALIEKAKRQFHVGQEKLDAMQF